MYTEILFELLVDFDFVIVCEEDIRLLLLLLLLFFLKLSSFNLPELIESAIRHLITFLVFEFFTLQLLQSYMMFLQVLSVYVAWHVVLLELFGLYD